nr:MAG TPA: hypothetical protein [Caudoviricetes sp.]
MWYTWVVLLMFSNLMNITLSVVLYCSREVIWNILLC